MASFWSRLKEVFYNFTQPIQDANMEQIDISDKEFESIALANGVSAEVLQELKNNRNGINITTSTKSRTKRVMTDAFSNEEVKAEKSKKQTKKDIEMER